MAIEAWRRAGITVGSRVLDVGAGPGAVRACGAILLASLLAVPAWAEDPTAPDVAAEAVIEAVAFGARAALADLARRDDPDPWWVVDVLLVRGARDAAKAFVGGRAATRVEALPRYIAARGNPSVEPGAREALEKGLQLLSEGGGPAEILKQIESAPGVPDTVATILLTVLRARMLRGLDRREEALDSHVCTGDAALRIGCLARAAMEFGWAGGLACQRGDQATALRWTEHCAELQRRRGAKERLTDFRENTLQDVITMEPELFLAVTGLTVKDFHLLVQLKVFNTERMHQAPFAFRRYEDASLRYTGIESHAGAGGRTTRRRPAAYR